MRVPPDEFVASNMSVHKSGLGNDLSQIVAVVEKYSPKLTWRKHDNRPRLKRQAQQKLEMSRVADSRVTAYFGLLQTAKTIFFIVFYPKITLRKVYEFLIN